MLFLVEFVLTGDGNPDPEAVSGAAEIAQRQAVAGVEQLGTGNADNPARDVLGIVNQDTDGVGCQRDAIGEEQQVIGPLDQRRTPVVQGAGATPVRPTAQMPAGRRRISHCRGRQQLTNAATLLALRVAQHQHLEPRVVLRGERSQGELGVRPP